MLRIEPGGEGLTVRLDEPGHGVAPELVAALNPLTEGSWLHCCAPGPWVDVARRAGFTWVPVDSRLTSLDESRDAGQGLILGVADTTRAPQTAENLVRKALRALRPST